MKKWTDRMETPIQAELICYDVNGIHIVFGVTKEKALKLFHFSSAPFDAENLCRKPDNWWPMEGMREAQIEESFQLVQVNFSGYNRPYEKHGNKYIVAYSFHSFNPETLEDIEMFISDGEIKCPIDYCNIEIFAAVMKDIRKNHPECVQSACNN